MCFDEPTPSGVRTAVRPTRRRAAIRRRRQEGQPGNRMTDRRSLIKSLAGAALLGATAANAQRAKSVTIGYLALLPGEDRMSFMASFMRRLNELGYVEGKSLHFEYRSADGRPELLPALAAELVGMKPDVLVTGFGTVAAKAAKAAAAGGIPVVFMAVGDPVGANIVESLARPGGNVTGLSALALLQAWLFSSSYLRATLVDCRDKMRARIAASSGLFALKREIPVCAGLRGGAG